MSTYFDAVKKELADKKVALLVLVFTVARVIYGLAWVQSGWGKLAWLTDGKMNSFAKIDAMVVNIAGPKVTKFDPLYINKVWGWIGTNIFNGMPGLTDGLVVTFEIFTGLAMIFGIRIFWAALVMMFMNVQFMAGGSFNNFGYIWTNLAMLKFAKYAELIGLDGYLRFRKNKQLLVKSDTTKAA